MSDPVVQLDENTIEAIGRTFSTPVGQACLKWLREQTIERGVQPGSTSSEALWYLEGKRDLVRLIERKVKQWQG